MNEHVRQRPSTTRARPTQQLHNKHNLQDWVKMVTEMMVTMMMMMMMMLMMMSMMMLTMRMMVLARC